MPAALPLAASRRRPAGRDERGSVAVEFAIGAPILLGVLLLLLQMFAWGMGYLAARAAADHAVQISRVVGGNAGAGTADGDALLHQLGSHFVDNPSVAVTRGADITTVTIHGRAHGLPLPIDITVQAPTERYTP